MPRSQRHSRSAYPFLPFSKGPLSIFHFCGCLERMANCQMGTEQQLPAPQPQRISFQIAAACARA